MMLLAEEHTGLPTDPADVVSRCICLDGNLAHFQPVLEGRCVLARGRS